MNLLFICNQGENRSRTAAEIYSKKFNTSYAGFYSFNKSLLLKEQMLEMADAIFVMEKSHIENLVTNYEDYYFNKRIINLEIPDVYSYNQPELVDLLKKKINPYIKELKSLMKHF